MIYSCIVCEEDLDGDAMDVTFCGYCSVVGHNSCLKIQKAVSNFLRGHGNVRWFCENCSNNNFHQLIQSNSKLCQSVENMLKPFGDLRSILERIDDLATNVIVLNNRIAAQQELVDNGSFCVFPNAKRLRSGQTKSVHNFSKLNDIEVAKISIKN